MKKGFDTDIYLVAQIKEITRRLNRFKGNLYLEFGGKLCYDYHAARVLPGFQPDAKVKILQRLKEKSEIIYCISAKDIQKGKIRRDFGLTYDDQALKDIDDIKKRGLEFSCVVITRFKGEERAKKFRRRLESRGIDNYYHFEISQYPNNLDLIVSNQGYGRQEYIKMKKPIIIITAPGPGSGKMSVCLSQIFHDRKSKIQSGYAKFETFPIWNLPIDHPVNIAYEAATADIGDSNMIDPFHLKAYNIIAVNYNRDVENFAIMKNIINRLVDEDDSLASYKSPTDMCVNQVAVGIIDDEVVREAARQEIIRRYFRYNRGLVEGVETPETVERIKMLMQKAGVKIEGRKVVEAARKAAIDAKRRGKGDRGYFCGAAIELQSGKIVTGKNSPLLHAESAAILNAIKELAKIPDEINLLPPNMIRNISGLKTKVLGGESESLNVEETLIALAIGVATNPMAELGIKVLKGLKNCEMHTTHITAEGDEVPLIKMGINLTSDANLTPYPVF